ncbi:MAG TPA: ATP-dependent helicase [Candidatus Limnocylindrales bacterium]|nr:ATP-dependent helicase [Candidatus Limnocylindrales bacterium]
MSLHPAVEDRLARLADDQRAAATAPPGPVLCVAPAGSGKTTTLVARICWLVAGGTDPEQITAVTFNKRAADELEARLKEALAPLGDTGPTPRVRTFHALGREILVDAGVTVSNLMDRAEVLRRLNGKPLRSSTLRRFDDAISRLKLDDMVDADEVRQIVAAQGELPNDPAICSAFVAYEDWLKNNGALDFDDLVRLCLRRLRADPVLLARWRERCRVMLVDEVQDVDRTQLELALLLAGEQPNVFLVGDDDQTIYAWRLADVRRVLELAGALSGLRRVDLVTNYRCPRPVVQRAVRLVERNQERFAKMIQAGPSAAGDLVLCPDPGDDVARARRLLTTWFKSGTGGHAVLSRTNAELAPFAAVAIELGIPYRAADDGLALDDARLNDVLDALPVDQPPAVALAGVQWLAAWALPYRTADDFRAAVGHARDQRRKLRREDAELVLATAHGTKGLEFDHVVCIGNDEGVFPSRRTLEEAENPTRALEEERRLAYVAWTRARKSLTLVYDPSAPSVFMRDAFSADELQFQRVSNGSTARRMLPRSSAAGSMG